MKTRHRMWIFGFLSILMIGFIWSRSIMTREQSSGESLSLLALLMPILDCLGFNDTEAAHIFLRKAAHFGEFCALGLPVYGFAVNLGILRNQRLISLPVLVVLSVAVTDEFIQLLVGRAGMVSDVVLDFAGGVTGLCIAALCCLLLQRRNKKRTRWEDQTDELK